MRFAEKIVPHANIIQLKREEETLTNIKQYQVCYQCFLQLITWLLKVHCRDMDQKYDALANIYATLSVGQVLIFKQKFGFDDLIRL
jgi:ATP-dependent RNA helicase DDX19/DBP5